MKRLIVAGVLLAPLTVAIQRLLVMVDNALDVEGDDE